MRPQTARKASPLAWAPELPAHWEVARICQVARLESGHTPSRQHPEYWVPDECTIPWFSLADVWQLRPGIREYLGETSEKISPRGMANSAARLLPAGTVILSRTASVGFSGIMPRPMATTQDFANFVPGPRVLPEYMLYVLRGMRTEFDRATMGSTHQTIYMPDLRRLAMPVPTMVEQKAIVALLRQRLPRLDALIAKKERLVELLAEKRQAMITQAVTKGLDPGVAMKDSGIAAIGRMPAHWKVGALRRWCSIVDCKHRTANYVDVGLPVVSTTEVKPGRLNVSVSQRFVAQADFDDLIEGGRRPARGDIIYSRNASLGAAAYVDTDEPFAMGQDVVLLRSRHLNSLFLSQVLNSSVGSRQVDLACIGATFKRINVADIGSILVPCPSVDEQANIADAIDAIDAKDAPALSAIATSITTLREYRQALITAAVTGQLDLSSDAAPPPDPTALEEPATA